MMVGSAGIRKRRRLLTVGLCCLAVPALAQKDAYLSPALPVEGRVSDLVKRMTLEEKIAQMQNHAPAIPRLHVAEYDWWNEGLHGVARSGYATVFPQAIGLAATWDAALMQGVGDVISTEARAKYNQAQREGNHSIFYGLTIWSPNINIERDPRWGRGQETYGEDPFLTGSIGSAFVKGLQGADPKTFKVIATAKHFAVHSGPESSRHTLDVQVSPHDLEDTYLPAFRRLVVDAHADSVMCAYNAVDGAPACASELLLKKKLRGDWGFEGPVVSDCAAITDVAKGHKFAEDLPHAAAVSVKAGTDLSCGKEYAALADAVHHGLIAESVIDESVKRLFTARFRLGMFDPPGANAYDAIPFSVNDSAEHRAMSLQAARESIVLLKNEHGALPLAARAGTIAVIGPNAAALPALEGNYNAVASYPVTPLDALSGSAKVLYSQGSAYVEGLPVPVPRTVLSSDGGPGLKAEYFAGVGFEGRKVGTRTDPQIDFDWNGAAPISGVSQDAFSVRWTGFISAPTAAPIQFGFSMAHCSTCEDAETVHVWLDGKPVYAFVHAATSGRRAPTPPFLLSPGDSRPHAIRIEYTHAAPHFGAGLTFNWNPPATALREEAVAAASKADVIVAFLGLSPEIEGEEMPVHVEGFEGGDRTTIELPETQQKLVRELVATHKPLILVLMSGGAVALGNAGEAASAILEAWYPGEVGGTAIAETIFGENNPSGRLPLTFYRGTSQLPRFDDYAMKDRTYRYFTGQAAYPFGFGLSYASFHYDEAKLSTKKLRAGESLQADVKLRNTGAREATEVVECYLIPKGKPDAPLRSLVGFQRSKLRPGESETVHFAIDPRELSLVDAAGVRSVQPGEYELYLGGGPPTAGAATGQGVYQSFRIEGSSAIAP